MALITLSCFLRKGYEDKLVLAGEESCRASRIGRRQACSLLQVLSITLVSHSPPWLLLTVYSFSSCKSPTCILISNIPCTDYRAISPSILCPLRGRWFVRVKSWPWQCQQSQDLIPGFPLRECFLFCTKAGYGATAAVSRAPLRKSNPLQKKCRDVFRGRRSDVKWRDGWRWKNQPHNNLTSSREG